MANARDKHIERMKELEEEIKSAGCIHKKDLQRELKRTKTQLMEYDRWHRQAEVRT